MLRDLGRGTVVLVAGIVLAAATLVGVTLARPEPPTFPPSPVDPGPAATAPFGPVTYTVDASDPDRWVRFSLARRSVIPDAGPLEWDLAFRRFRIIVNGGEGFPGRAGLLDLGEAELEGVGELPSNGYEGTRVQQGDSIHPVVERWYDYSLFSHLLTPRRRVYAVRTADGRYATLELLSYYCPGAQPGCVTFRYEYHGPGGDSPSGGVSP